MTDANVLLCLAVPVMAAIILLYVLLYDGSERRRIGAGVVAMFRTWIDGK